MKPLWIRHRSSQSLRNLNAREPVATRTRGMRTHTLCKQACVLGADPARGTRLEGDFYASEGGSRTICDSFHKQTDDNLTRIG